MLQAPCLWIRDGGGAGVNGLDGIISGWMREGLEGWMDGREGGREGRVTRGTHQKKTE